MRYQVTEAAVQFGPGIVLGLTARQAADRRHRLTPVDEGFVVVDLVEFKVGEIVDIVSGDVGKALSARLLALDPPPDLLADPGDDPNPNRDGDPNPDPCDQE